MREILALCALVALTACAAKVSTIRDIQLSDGCAWVSVDESTVGLSVQSDDLPFHDELYYCCPSTDGEDPYPVCREASWLQKAK